MKYHLNEKDMGSKSNIIRILGAAFKPLSGLSAEEMKPIIYKVFNQEIYQCGIESTSKVTDDTGSFTDSEMYVYALSVFEFINEMRENSNHVLNEIAKENGWDIEKSKAVCDSMNKKYAEEKALNRIKDEYFTFNKNDEGRYGYEKFINRFLYSTNGHFDYITSNSTVNSTTVLQDAIVISFLLLKNHKNDVELKNTYATCLEILGITDIGMCEYEDLLNFSFSEKEVSNGKTLLRSNSVIAFGATIYMALYITGKEPDVIKLESKRFYMELSQLFSVATQLDAIEKRLIDQLNDFKPRSIDTKSMVRKIKPQEIYEIPQFKPLFEGYNVSETVQPIDYLNDSKNGFKCLIKANTGTGKSMFFRMLSLCFMCYGAESNNDDSYLDDISDKLHVSSRKYVIYIPARMYSSCYQQSAFQDRPIDLIKMYYHCMSKLSKNFYDECLKEDHTFSPISGEINLQEIKRLLYILARKGNLVFLFDSYDEIPNDDMRSEFLKSLNSLYREFLRYSNEDNQIGAHYLIASRGLSSSAMTKLTMALEFEHPEMTYELILGDDERKRLAKSIYMLTHKNTSISSSDLELVLHGHIYEDFAENPYMLSFISSSYGENKCFKEIIDVFLKRYITRIVSNHSSDNTMISDILKKLPDIFQKIAIEISAAGKSVFPVDLINNHIRERLVTFEISEEQSRLLIEETNRIIVTEAGLVIPADNDSSDEYYKFINRRVQYEFAAKELYHQIAGSGSNQWHDYIMLRDNESSACYLGIVTALVCQFEPGLRNDKAENIICDLLTHKNSNQKEYQDCMLDIFSGIYGPSIATAAASGGENSRRIQKVMLLRYLHGNDESLDEAIRSTNAYVNNKDWIAVC